MFLLEKIERYKTSRLASGLWFLAAIFAVLMHGCTYRSQGPVPEIVYPEKPPAEEEVGGGSYSGPAYPLYVEASEALSRGDNQLAELNLERALRVEPGNPLYWHAMGRVKYRSGAYNQAVQFCLKSKSLARGDRKLIRLNDRLIEQARLELH